MFPTDPVARKAVPLCTGVLDYFPDALAAVAGCSQAGNDQHNPGEPLHWARAKSGDEADALLRHLTERGTIDTDGIRHSAKVAWRALAMLQKELEAAGAPVARGAREGWEQSDGYKGWVAQTELRTWADVDAALKLPAGFCAQLARASHASATRAAARNNPPSLEDPS